MTFGIKPKSQAEMEYTNQDKVKREWDKYGNLTKEWLYNKTTQQWDLMLENVYQDPVTGEDKSDKKELQRTIDNYASRVYNYLYDDLGQLQQVQTMQNGVEVFKTEVEKQGTRLSKVLNIKARQAQVFLSLSLHLDILHQDNNL